jgi:hypothetical protein
MRLLLAAARFGSAGAIRPYWLHETRPFNRGMNRILPLAIATALTLASCGSGDEAAAPPADTTPEEAASTTGLTTTTLVTSTTSLPADSAPSSDPASTPDNLVADDVAYASISDLQRLDIYAPTASHVRSTTSAPPTVKRSKQRPLNAVCRVS